MTCTNVLQVHQLCNSFFILMKLIYRINIGDLNMKLSFYGAEFVLEDYDIQKFVRDSDENLGYNNGIEYLNEVLLSYKLNNGQFKQLKLQKTPDGHRLLLKVKFNDYKFGTSHPNLMIHTHNVIYFLQKYIKNRELWLNKYGKPDTEKLKKYLRN